MLFLQMRCQLCKSFRNLGQNKNGFLNKTDQCVRHPLYETQKTSP